jgi:hypothetical protein
LYNFFGTLKAKPLFQIFIKQDKRSHYLSDSFWIKKNIYLPIYFWEKEEKLRAN